MSASRSGDELRPVTALFADIVGSTSLGERLAPGEVKALVGECVSRMSRAVEEFGGTIQAYTGDGICAYFGVPAAHEDDPERAGRSGLRILEVAREYANDVEAAWGIGDFNVRVGINSGQTGVGMVGGAVPQAVALGDATNWAARLQSAAEPGTIAVGAETARHLADRFVLEPLGELVVKGRAEAVAAWKLTGPREDAEVGRTAPLVGREAEMARLDSMVQELLAGRGQVLLVIGEAGIGKSRMLRELRGIAAGTPITWLQGTCVSYGREGIAGPFVQILRSWLGVEETEAEVAVRMRLRAKLSTLLGRRLDEVLPALARLLQVKVDPDESIPSELSPEERHNLIDRAYRTWVEALAASSPVVLAVDDLHWAYESTRTLAEGLLPVTDGAPLMVVAALRPDPESQAWPFRLRVLADFPHRAVELPLGPLTDAAAMQLADLILSPDMVDEATKGGIVQRAEGNPLFLEELLRGLTDATPADRDRGGTWTISLSHLLPSSLEGLFAARIDRLPPGARRLVQVAAVIGREFPHRILERLGESDDLQADLSALLRADLIRELRRYPDLEYRFRHGLVQEAALSSLTLDNLRELSGRVGAAFEEMYAGALEEHLEVLAYHFYRSDDLSKALPYLERAAEVALEDAPDRAAELLGRAARTAARLGDDQSERRIRARLGEMGRS